MKGYLRRCYRQCQSDSSRAKMKELLMSEIGKITAAGELSSTNWADKPVLQLS
jgi:hypothetical protein